jgi:ketosteroid isomerase-like protein
MSQENVMRGVRYPVSLPSERAAQRRTLDESLFLRFPFLFRLIADRITRLPPGSRLRQTIVARLVGRGNAAANRRDFDVAFLALDPGIEYHPRQDQIALDQDAVYYGHSGYREMWRKWTEAFEDVRLEPEEVLDLGDRLLATVQVRAHGSGSGLPLNTTDFKLFKLRRGLVVWQQDFGDHAEALEAAGLSE